MSHPNHTVFYGQQVYGEYPDALPSMDLPDGCYLQTKKPEWYIKIGGGFTPINLCDIPPEVRVNCLLLGIPV